MIRAVPWLVLLSAVTWSGVSTAQAKSDAAAEAIFQQGLAAVDRGDHAAACPLFERAIELSSTEALGGMLTLADCYEHVGRPSSAWGVYKRVAARAIVAKEEDRARQAERAAARLEPTLPRVRFTRPSAAPPGLRVRVGADTVPADVWQVSIPVDPGSATFTFEANGLTPVTKTVVIPSGPSTTDVTAPTLSRAPAPDSRPAGPQPVATTTPAHDGGGLGSVGIAGVVVGGIGVIGAASSAGVMSAAKSDWQAAVDADCDGDPTRCRTLDGVDAARATGTVGTAVFGVGLGLAAIGAGLFIYDLVGSSKSSATPTARFDGGVDPGSGEASARLSLGWTL